MECGICTQRIVQQKLCNQDFDSFMQNPSRYDGLENNIFLLTSSINHEKFKKYRKAIEVILLTVQLK